MCAVLASVRNTVCLVYNQPCGFITGKRYKTGDDDDDDDDGDGDDGDSTATNNNCMKNRSCTHKVLQTYPKSF